MPALEYTCRVLEVVWLTPTVFSLKFEPSRRFSYLPGQFVSVVVPRADASSRSVKRAYSFALPSELAKQSGYELCVKAVPGGVGSTYLAGLKPGDDFRMFAPYGDFIYTPSTTKPRVCFICTGTGVGPFRAMVLSREFQENPPAQAFCLFGARDESEIFYRGLFERLGIHTIYALSRPKTAPDPDSGLFAGRVTDYLRSLPADWGWQATQFYLCGNGAMIDEARRLLVDGRSVSANCVRQEVYFTSPAVAARKAA